MMAAARPGVTWSGGFRAGFCFVVVRRYASPLLSKGIDAMEAPSPPPAAGNEPPVDELLELAVDLARRAGEIHRAGRGAAAEEKSSRFDLVTAVDREAERALVAGILAARPFDGILGEEGTSVGGTSGVRWIVDPLDGTTNFVYGYPDHAVSIGIEVGGLPVVGVVLNSTRGDLFTGVRGRGAWMNGEPISAAGRDEVATALIVTGFSYDPAVRGRQAEVLVHLLPRTRDLRRSGSAALDLCHVAAGFSDLYYECPIGLWDVAAGRVIAEAAGAAVIVGSLPGWPGNAVLAANPRLLANALPVLLQAGMDFTQTA
jgi:myo-inositol-1(or 4)-monophosphatase